MNIDGNRHLQRADMLSELPDDVLLNILQRVGTLDAVRTCALSKRLIRLPAMLSRIVIVLGARKLVRKNGAVADAIDKILSTMSPQDQPTRELKLRFILRGDDHLRIGRSVALAMAKHKIETAEFEILTKKHASSRLTRDDVSDFGEQFGDFIDECPGAFAGLTRLHLQYLRLDDLDVRNILGTCKRLESLSFFSCDVGFRSELRIEHPTLVHVDIKYGSLRTVELTCVPMLQHVTYEGWPWAEHPLYLGFAPRLSQLSLARTNIFDMTLSLSQLLANVPSISDLRLDFKSEKIWIQPERRELLAPLLGKLKLVNLDNLPEECDITWTMFFLEAASSIQELCITVWDHECKRKSQKIRCEKTDVKWEPSVAGFKHNNLTKLTIYGFRSDENFTRYVRRILKVAVNIKEVSLHDRKLCKLCTDKSDHIEVPSPGFPQTIDEEDSLRKHITEELVTASPAVIHFRPSCYYSPPVESLRSSPCM